MNYKGHEYEVMFCDPTQDWGDAKGLFRIVSTAGNTNKYYSTYKEAVNAAQKKIDEFMKNIPQTEDEWIEAIESCIIFECDYCEINEAMALDVLKKAKIHFSV